jgi:Arc/MetJ family transcription regulator
MQTGYYVFVVQHCRLSQLSSSHHDAVMIKCGVRTTIDLPDELHQQALAIARDTHRTLSETVADLMRRGLGSAKAAVMSVDPRTGFPVVSVGRVVTSEDVRSLEDEE